MKYFKVLPLVLAGMVMGLALPSVQGGILFTNLVSFTGTNGIYPGASPFCGLTLGADGNFYGTTTEGGSNNLGTIFRLTRGGAFTSLVSFAGTNGANPSAALVRGGDNNLYGTASAGGASNWGTIFLMTTNGALTNLFTFTGTNNPYQGDNPGSALVPAGDGSFYGTAGFGGLTNVIYQDGVALGAGYGTIFQLTTNRNLNVPVVFGNTNGANPSGNLLLSQDGNFYGTTTWGGQGVSATFPGYGTVFRMTPGGTLTNIYQFSGYNDGGYIYGGLVQGGDGYLYGAAFGGGTNGLGALFKISTNGSYVPLYSFAGSDGGSPYAGLTEGSDGNFYGTTYGYYEEGLGSVFSVTPGGAYTNLVYFNGTNGSYAAGVLLQGPDGNFYGTTSSGGAQGLGTVFRLSVPLPPEITTLTQTNGKLTLTWRAVAGQTYQVQSLADVTQTNWTSLTTPSVATDGVMTATNFDDVISPGQRFYRVVLE